MNLQKPTKIRSKKITKSARGESCTLRIQGVCNYSNETTVFAHIEGNKGTGSKNHDLFGVYCCSSCHDWLDGRNNNGIGHRSMGGYMAKLRALQETQIKLYNKGLIKI